MWAFVLHGLSGWAVGAKTRRRCCVVGERKYLCEKSKRGKAPPPPIPRLMCCAAHQGDRVEAEARVEQEALLETEQSKLPVLDSFSNESSLSTSSDANSHKSLSSQSTSSSPRSPRTSGNSAAPSSSNGVVSSLQESNLGELKQRKQQQQSNEMRVSVAPLGPQRIGFPCADDLMLCPSVGAPESGADSLIEPSDADDDLCLLVDGADSRQQELARSEFVQTFRMSSPYITAYSGAIFVIHVPGVLSGEPTFGSVMADIALLVSIGIRVVLVLGALKQVEQRLHELRIRSRKVDGLRVTSNRVLQVVKDAAGEMLFEVESQLNRGLCTAQLSTRVSVVRSSFFTAQPLGLVDGVDYGYTGKVRNMNVKSMRERLANNELLLLTNLGVSPSGELFNCVSEQVAAEAAAQLGAEKLIYFIGSELICDSRSERHVPNMTLAMASRFLADGGEQLTPHFRMIMSESVRALHSGVRRAHLLNRSVDGVLLMEVFHRDGVGLMISRNTYEGVRVAAPKDVLGILNMLAPLESQGRFPQQAPISKEFIEKQIGSFVVVERDGAIIACSQLRLSVGGAHVAEIACFAVHPEYQHQGKGLMLLSWMERAALAKSATSMVAVASRSSTGWFVERGFVPLDSVEFSRLADEVSSMSERGNGSGSGSSSSAAEKSIAATVVVQQRTSDRTSEQESSDETDDDDDDGDDDGSGSEEYGILMLKRLQSVRAIDEEDVLRRL